MAFPDDYTEQHRKCINREPHTFSTSGHPLSHRCLKCHRPKWVEVKQPEPVVQYVAGKLSDVNP